MRMGWAAISRITPVVVLCMAFAPVEVGAQSHHSTLPGHATVQAHEGGIFVSLTGVGMAPSEGVCD